jgi:hypothetical protein
MNELFNYIRDTMTGTGMTYRAQNPPPLQPFNEECHDPYCDHDGPVISVCAATMVMMGGIQKKDMECYALRILAETRYTETVRCGSR